MGRGVVVLLARSVIANFSRPVRAVSRPFGRLAASKNLSFIATTAMAKKSAILLLADGAEEMEAVITVDVLRRAGASLQILTYLNISSSIRKHDPQL